MVIKCQPNRRIRTPTWGDMNFLIRGLPGLQNYESSFLIGVRDYRKKFKTVYALILYNYFCPTLASKPILQGT